MSRVNQKSKRRENRETKNEFIENENTCSSNNRRRQRRGEDKGGELLFVEPSELKSSSCLTERGDWMT
jgi:hypothetical protein